MPFQKGSTILKICWMLILLTGLSLWGQSFTNVTASAGLGINQGLGHIATWIDYDADGWLDIFASTVEVNALYHNNGNGTFTNIIQGSGLEGELPNALAFADFDGDGYVDILMASNNVNQPVKLFRNLSGSGAFQVVFSSAEWGERAIGLDYNGDGHLDIFFNTGNDYPRLYRNNGDGTFTEVGSGMGFNSNSGQTCTAADWDNDGFADLFCATSSHTNRAYRNLAGEDYLDVTYAAHLSNFFNSVSSTWGDYDRDGDLDLYVAAISGSRNYLYQNQGNGRFHDVTLSAGAGDVGDARTSCWIDYDNDGWLDLFTTNHVHPNRLYRNQGDGTFVDVAQQAGIAGPTDGFDVSWGDYDRDGDLDVLIAGHFGGGLALLRNEGGHQKHSLQVRLQGTFDNASGIGARVWMWSGGSFQMQELAGGTGARGQNWVSLHFGLDSLTMVDSLVVLWPSGLRQRVDNVAADQEVVIVEQGNVPPRVFHLLWPADGATVEDSLVAFRWQSSTDPDSGRNITYALHLSALGEDSTLSGLSDTVAVVDLRAWGIVDSLAWWVEASDGQTSRPSWERWHVQYSPPTGITGDWLSVSGDYSLGQNHPNPFNSVTVIPFWLERRQRVKLVIYDVLGREVVRLVDKTLPAGEHRLTVQADGWQSGIYFYRLLLSPEQSSTGKMLLIR